MKELILFGTAALAILLAALAGCASPAPQPQYVTRITKDCSWIPRGTYSVSDTKLTKEWMIAYEKARQKNCQ